jgi:hypothetical protein
MAEAVGERGLALTPAQASCLSGAKPPTTGNNYRPSRVAFVVHRSAAACATGYTLVR